MVALVAGCGGGADEPELQPGVVRIGVVDAEPVIAEGAGIAAAEINNGGGIGGVLRIELVRGAARSLLARGVRVLVLPCRRGLGSAAALANARGAVAVAPCDDGDVPLLPKVFTSGLSPRGQADALSGYADGRAVDVVVPSTPRGERVRMLLRDLEPGSDVRIGADAPEHVRPPASALDGTAYATYGFPDPGNEVDEFYERYRSLYGRRPRSILAVLGADAVDVLSVAIESAASARPAAVATEIREGISVGGVVGRIEFAGGTNRPQVPAAIVRVDGPRLRLVELR